MIDEYFKNKVRENAVKVVGFLMAKKISLKDNSNFVEECVANAIYAGPQQFRFLTKKDIDNAVSMAEFWNDALADKEEYQKLVEHVIFSMLRIQCCAINNNAACEKLYIGSICRLNPASELANGSREFNLRRTYIGVGSKRGIVKA